MIKKILLVSLLFIAAAHVSAKEHIYCDSIMPKQYNYILEKQTYITFLIRYCDSTKNHVIYISEGIVFDAFYLDSNSIDKLAGFVQTYKDWDKKATRKKAKQTKQIGHIEPVNAYWRHGDDWHTAHSTKINVFFFSQTPKTHQIVFSFDKMKSKQNPAMKHQPGKIYFSYNEADKLAHIFSKEYFGEFIEKIEKQK